MLIPYINYCFKPKPHRRIFHHSTQQEDISNRYGIQSIIDGLKTNNTLNYLYLSNNRRLSRNMKSQLYAIQQYKRTGSNGYQQVKGMDIYK